MNHKKKQLTFLLSLIAVQAFAQYHISYKAASSYVTKVYDITYKKPKGFVDLKSSEFWKPGGRRDGIGFGYGPIFQSKDGNCIIMYPRPTLLLCGPHNILSARNYAEGEIKAALGLRDEIGHRQEESTIDFDKYITIHVDQDARQCFNADSVFIAELPIKKAYKDKYTYCTGIYVCKKDRPTLLFKYFFTEVGKQREQEYLKLLCKRIWYRNENWVYDEKKVIKADYEILYKDRYK